MKTFLIITMLLIFSNIYGQVPSIDNFTKVERIDALTVRITNLQNCPTAFDVKVPDSFTYHIITPVIQPNNSTIVGLTHCGEVRVQPLRNCNEANTECTIVGLNTCFVLGVQGIEKFEANRSGRGVEVLLKLTSETNIGRIEILTGVDRKNFVPVMEFKPQGKLTYYFNIKN